MNEATHPTLNFNIIYNKSYRLASAVFVVSNIMSQDEELRTKIKKLSLELVSLSVNLKDADFGQAKKIMSDIEKNSLELMSMLDIASVAGLISKMNGDIIRGEFEVFISELEGFSEKFEENKNVSVKSIFTENRLQIGSASSGIADSHLIDNNAHANLLNKNEQKQKNMGINGGNNGLKRKDLRKNMILGFIKRHNNVSIKDIVPHINGCSEKTVQRELTSLINEGKIKKLGERRWSKYSIL